MREAEYRTQRASSATRRAFTVLTFAALASAMTACSSGGGGDSGRDDANGGNSAPSGLTFTYPADGQTDVYTQSQVALSFAGDPGDLADDLSLIANPGTEDAESVAVTIGEPESGIYRLRVAGQGDSLERPPLAPQTKYAVSDGDTTLFTFTTRSAPGRPAADGFAVVEYRGDSADPFPFTQLNTVRVTFSEPIDPATAQLGDSVSVTDSSGMTVAGRLNAQGRYLSFDPEAKLVAGETYTVTLDTGDDAIRSVFGNTLQANGDASFDLTPVNVGNDVEQNLVIEPSNSNPDALPDNDLNGQPANLVTLVSQLVGENQLPALNNSARRGLITQLAEPSSGPRYRGTIPAVIPAGQQFDLGALNLSLGGGVPTQVNSGHIEARFLDDADVFIMANNLTGIETPTAIRLRFNLGIGAAIDAGDQQQTLANGAFNQTIMNVKAAGLAIPQTNGDLKLITLGSFPTAVNRNGRAITDFELELTLKAQNQDSVQPDATQPYLTAQYPSACLYTFGAGLTYLQDETGTQPVALESAEMDCAQATPPLKNQPAGTGEPGGISSFLPNQSPSLTFSEPIDPRSLTNAVGGHDSAHIDLVGPNGPVAFTAQTEGNSVVIDPVERLATDTEYTMQVGAQVTDLAGNAVADTVEQTFRTAPHVDAAPVQSFDTMDDQGNTVTTFLNNVAQTAPFITTIQPGLPCALDPASGDFMSGGDTAGYCLNDQQDSQAPSTVFSVFSLPANQPIKAQFTKPVMADTITLADGCLTGSGAMASTGASVAVQRMSDDGSCDGVVEGQIRLPQPDQGLTRSFTFVPNAGWQDGQRYWLVICGDQQDQCSTAAGTIVGRDDGDGVRYRNTDGDVVSAPYSGNLNTDPLNGTGTQPSQSTGLPDDAAESNRLSQGFRPAGGGPDIVMPFEGAPATRDYSLFADSLPIADSNGNGIFEGQRVPPDQTFSPIPESVQPQQEHHIGANATYVQPVSSFADFNDQQAVYQSGAVPNIVKPLTTECSDVSDVIGTVPAQCIPVELTAGGMFQLTALTANRNQGTQTGRILLRVVRNEDGSRQRGYIVPECSGTIGTGDDARDYEYSPCFVQSLGLLTNGPDGFGEPLANIDFAQQRLTLDLVGPVNFERNGRLVLTLSNVNEAVLDDITINFVFQPFPVTITPGDAHIQLAGPAIHGQDVTVQ